MSAKSQPRGTIVRRAERNQVSQPRTGSGDPKRDVKESADDREAMRELAERRDFLLRSIDDLNEQRDKGEVSDEDYALLCDDYTARAAEVIRAIESPARTKVRSADTAVRSGDRRIGITVVAVIGVLVVGVLAGVMVARSSGTEPAESGMPASGGAVAGDQTSGQVAELMATAQSLIASAQRNLQAGDGAAAATASRQALQTFDEILAIEPDNVEAMTYRGWLLHNLAVQTEGSTSVELDAEALEWLNRAVAIDPVYPDARVFRAVLLDSAGRPAEALADLDALDMKTVPPVLTELIESRRASIEAQLNQPGGTSAVDGGM